MLSMNILSRPDLHHLQVGSGKTTLLQGILGEVHRTGTAAVRGRLGKPSLESPFLMWRVGFRVSKSSKSEMLPGRDSY